MCSQVHLLRSCCNRPTMSLVGLQAIKSTSWAGLCLLMVMPAAGTSNGTFNPSHGTRPWHQAPSIQAMAPGYGTRHLQSKPWPAQVASTSVAAVNAFQPAGLMLLMLLLYAQAVQYCEQHHILHSECYAEGDRRYHHVTWLRHRICTVAHAYWCALLLHASSQRSSLRQGAG